METSTSSSPPLLQIRSGNKRFRQGEVETSALRDVSVSVGSGELVAIHGPSGCGKSTLLSVLGLLTTLDSGELQICGIDARRVSEAEAARIRRDYFGFVFQAFHLIDELTAEENVALPLTLRGVKESAALTAAREALERVALSNRNAHFPAQLSGGQQQRVAIARALVGKPSVILADEPTGNLDQENGSKVIDMLVAARDSGTSVLLVTHDARHLDSADRVLRMVDGRLQGD